MRLYPRNWRSRYGTEFHALLDDMALSTRDVFDILLGAVKMQMTNWNFARLTVAGSIAGLLAGAALSFAAPVRYASQVLLTVTPPSGLTTESVRGTVEDLKADILGRVSLESLIRAHNLYSRELLQTPLDKVVDEMRNSIRVSSSPSQDSKSLNFVLQFSYPDPHVAQEVDADLIQRFMEGAVTLRTAEPEPRIESGSVFQVLDPPTFPVAPISPNRTRFAATGLSAGLIAGLVFGFVFKSRQSSMV